jgi:Zn-dependent M16 (insulinase) family peptidase
MRHRCWIAGVLLVVACSAPTAPPKTAAPPPDPGSAAPPPKPGELGLEALEQGKATHGFTARAVYLDGADQPIGARLVHDKTGFTLDYLRIESAPQGFLWVTTYPTSDKGEPHTQEHLLLGKGNRGRKLGSFEAMALAESSAFTEQYRTCYHFHTVAGHDVFWPVFEDQLDAMLNPDYTDEEIRREVRNFGVDRADNGALRLEEKGTVYNEMVRTYEASDTVLFRTVSQMVYGAQHPLAFESGGYPDAIRTMTPADIRAFHDATYHLANMGMIAAFPSSMSLASVLDHTAVLLDKEAGRIGKVLGEANLPKPAGAKPEAIELAEYPYGDTTSPSPLVLAWPATRDLGLTDRTLLDLFLGAFGGDESTVLYKKLIDSKTRAIDLGASGVMAFASPDQGEPVMVWVSGVAADKLDAAMIGRVRGEVMAELQRIAKLPDGDPELVAFNKGVQSRVTELRRRLAKFLDSPPGFGFRNASSAWLGQLRLLEKVSGFKKSVTLRPELAKIEQLLAGTANPWRDRLRAWGLLETPYGAGARPSPALRARVDGERQQRIDAELVRLGQQYKAKAKAATLAAYQADYDKETQRIEEAAKATVLPPLVDTPPMTLDDELAYTTERVAGVPAFRATIDSMQSARVSVAFRLDAVPEADLMYLALLPELMSQVGVFENGAAITSAAMRERLRKEILELNVRFVTSPRANRTELVVAGAGNDAAETRLALGWMARAMFAADWRIENLPRLRDVVDQEVTALRQEMQGAEEAWVRDPHDAWWRQAFPLHLHTSSFLTRAHDLHRLRWMLLDPSDPKLTAEVAGFLGELAAASSLPRKQLDQVIAGATGGKAQRWSAAFGKLSPNGKALAHKALEDLKALLPELPDGSLAADWAYLCKQMAHDLQAGAPAALDRLRAVRAAIVAAGNARIVEIGSPASHAAIAKNLAALAGKLDQVPRARQAYVPRRPIAERLLDHDTAPGEPRYVGLVDPATSSGVFLNSAPSTALTNTAEDAVLDYLASNTFTGHGAHSLFMKTWAAGLAYSNGVHPLVQQGQLEYYAERCPLLPQTLRFVIDQLKAAKIDPNIARYAIATAFDSRVAASYEQRAAAMAGDITDGITPQVVKAFRQKLLALASHGDLAQALAARMPRVYGAVMPGFGPAASDGVYFVIGPAKQLAAYEDYLHAAVGKTTVLHRLYPRDFWIPAKL